LARGLTVTLWRQKRIQSPNSTGPCNLEPHGRILPQLSLLIIQCYRNREGKVHPQRDRSHDAGAGTGNHGSRQELKIGPRDQVPTVISDLETQTQPLASDVPVGLSGVHILVEGLTARHWKWQAGRRKNWQIPLLHRIDVSGEDSEGVL
jgi:hypothetical protein